MKTNKLFLLTSDWFQLLWYFDYFLIHLLSLRYFDSFWFIFYTSLDSIEIMQYFSICAFLGPPGPGYPDPGHGYVNSEVEVANMSCFFGVGTLQVPGRNLRKNNSKKKGNVNWRISECANWAKMISGYDTILNINKIYNFNIALY